ncbi:WbqC family protein [Microcoleus sp. MON2_D6]|uniref:WbqC family protein n=1 Tax=unclassified Microcoleus TaxID=2642155 RepID=UPI002FD770FA
MVDVKDTINMKIVISQPMFFPWVGLFEQIQLADIYVHYNDVQFSKGSFVNRVQIKTNKGSQWLTVPLQNLTLGQEIREVELSQKKWRASHLAFLSQSYAKAPYKNDMIKLVEQVYKNDYTNMSELAIASIETVCSYLGIGNHTNFLYSSHLGIEGKSDQRVLEIVKYLKGTTYVTGHGARNYLDHELFEGEGVTVEYMNYQKKAYPQLHGGFTPYVSVLDLIANVGQEGGKVISPTTINWKEFLK